MITIVSIPNCPWCTKVKAVLKMHGIPFDESHLSDPPAQAAFARTHNVKTFPQVFHDTQRIGGYEDTVNWIARGGHL